MEEGGDGSKSFEAKEGLLDGRSIMKELLYTGFAGVTSLQRIAQEQVYWYTSAVS